MAPGTQNGLACTDGNCDERTPSKSCQIHCEMAKQKLAGSTDDSIDPRNSYPSQRPTRGFGSRGKGGAVDLSCYRNNRAGSGGPNVSELNAEMTVETAIVSANCLKNWPVMPVMNAHGMNTAANTRPTAITGPE